MIVKKVEVKFGDAELETMKVVAMNIAQVDVELERACKDREQLLEQMIDSDEFSEMALDANLDDGIVANIDVEHVSIDEEQLIDLHHMYERTFMAHDPLTLT